MLRAACALHANGEETADTVSTVARISKALSTPCRVIPTWDRVLITTDAEPGDGGYATVSGAATPTSIGMNRVVEIHRIVADVESHRLTAETALDRLEEAATAPLANTYLFALASALGAGALALIFGAQHWQAVTLVAFSGGLGALLRRFLAAHAVGVVAQAFAAALLAGLIGAAAVRLQVSSDLRLVAVCACMILVPGPHILNGALDLASLRIPLGIARLTFATLILGAISAGLVIGLALGGTDLPVTAPARSVPLWLDVPAAGVAVAAYSVFFSIPLRLLAWPITVGMAAHAARWAVISFGMNAAEGVGIASLVVGGIMVPVSKRLNLPFAGVGFACVVSLMPGLFIFRLVSGLMQLQQTPSLSSTVATDAMTAVLIVLCMTLGLVLPKHIYNQAKSAGARGQAP